MGLPTVSVKLLFSDEACHVSLQTIAVTDSVLGKVESLESANIYLRFSPGAPFLCQTWVTSSRDCCARCTAFKDNGIVVREQEDCNISRTIEAGDNIDLDQWTEGCFEHCMVRPATVVSLIPILKSP